MTLPPGDGETSARFSARPQAPMSHPALKRACSTGQPRARRGYLLALDDFRAG